MTANIASPASAQQSMQSVFEARLEVIKGVDSLSCVMHFCCQTGGILHNATSGLQVTPEGEYKPPPPSNSKASYATMMYVRATIVEGAGWALARSVTIAVRPSHSLTAATTTLPRAARQRQHVLAALGGALHGLSACHCLWQHRRCSSGSQEAQAWRAQAATAGVLACAVLLLLLPSQYRTAVTQRVAVNALPAHAPGTG